ncbi:caspase family protein [Breznakiellaceae bacterium SP9]
MKTRNAVFFTVCLALCVTSLFAQQKQALIIGNSAYTSVSRLNNPVNDANDMKAVLETLGFQVEILTNAGRVQMEAALERFKTRLSRTQNTYGFFYYAGHGVESSGENYLIPVDAEIRSEAYLRDRAVPVQAVLDEINAAGNSLNIVVLDACRNNPFSWSRSGTRGLAVVKVPPADSIIVYAAGAGAAAADGTGRNGLFTTHLLNNLKKPGLEVREVFRLTQGDVRTASNNAQQPATYDQSDKLAYLGSRPSVQPASAPEQPAVPDDFAFQMSSAGVTITKYKGNAATVVIPDRILGVPVTSIRYMAFYSCDSLTTVSIPNSVTSIGDSAFSWCKSLTAVTIPNSVTSIGRQAFSHLKSITLSRKTKVADNAIPSGAQITYSD